MRKTRILIFLAAILLVSIACQTSAALFETGSISITSPANGTKSHADAANAITVPVSVQSSFTSPKTATFYLDGIEITNKDGSPYQCILEPGANTNCGNLLIGSTGVHKIRVDISKIDGSTVSAETSVEWSPFSSFDKFAMGLPGANGSPSAGFGIIFIAMLFAGVLLGIVIGKAQPSVIALMVALSLIALAAFFFSAGSAAGGTTIATGIVAALILVILGWIAVRVIAESNKKSTMTTMYEGWGGRKFGRQITTADSNLLSDSISADSEIIQTAFESDSQTHQIPWTAIRKSLELRDGNDGEEND